MVADQGQGEEDRGERGKGKRKEEGCKGVIFAACSDSVLATDVYAKQEQYRSTPPSLPGQSLYLQSA
jgi:hypothetical protein